MILDEGESGFFYPKIYLVKLDDDESSLKLGDRWWSDEQENRLIFLFFEPCGSLEDWMISEVFLLMISWEDKSKVLLGPDVFFNELGNEVEGIQSLK